MGFYRDNVRIPENWDVTQKAAEDGELERVVVLATPYVESLAAGLLYGDGVPFFGRRASLKGFETGCRFEDVVHYGLVHVLENLGKYDASRSRFAGWVRDTAVKGMLRGVVSNEYGFGHGINLMEKARREMRDAKDDKGKFARKMMNAGKHAMGKYDAFVLFDLLANNVEQVDGSRVIIDMGANVEERVRLESYKRAVVNALNKDGLLSGSEAKVGAVRLGVTDDSLKLRVPLDGDLKLMQPGKKGKKIDAGRIHVSEVKTLRYLREKYGDDWIERFKSGK